MGISSGIGAVGFVPVGVVVPFAGSTSPAGWELCYGQAISRTTYAGLFATISTTYGSGDGSTTFNVPDLRGRVSAGKDDMGGTAASRLTSTVLTASNTLGATGGTQTHTLTEAQMPAHSHTYPGAANGDGGGSFTAVVLNVTSVVNTSSVGSSAAHLNTQPTIVLNYIIKAA